MIKPTKAQRLECRNEPDNLIPVMYQTWENLLFLHWEVKEEEISKGLPEGLYADTYNNKSFAAITPFTLKNLHLPFLPPLPFAGNFFETNVRTYIFNDEGIPGIWFYSLYANNVLAVEAAKQIPLPYKTADINVAQNNSSINYNLSNIKEDPAGKYEFNYILNGKSFYPDSDSLEFFLVERYFLFYLDRRNKLKKIRVNHQPYPLQNIKLLNYSPSLLKLNNINPLFSEPVHAIFSPGPGEVKIYIPEKN